MLAYGIVGGRLATRGRLADEQELESITGELAGHLSDRGKRGLGPDEVDGTVIVAAWLRDRGEQDGYVFPLEPPDAQKKWPATQLAEWRAACRSLLVPAAG